MACKRRFDARRCRYRRTSSRAVRALRSVTTHAQFLRVVALGSASEVRYLLGLSSRLELLAGTTELEGRYDELVRGLQGLLTAVERSG